MPDLTAVCTKFQKGIDSPMRPAKQAPRAARLMAVKEFGGYLFFLTTSSNGMPMASPVSFI